LFISLLSFHIIINNTKENLFYFIFISYKYDVRITNICDTKSIINDKNMDTVTIQIAKPEETDFEQSLL